VWRPCKAETWRTFLREHYITHVAARLTRMASAVTDNRAAQRFEMDLGGSNTAFISYYRKGSVLTLVHAEVPPEFEGRGFGTRLTRGALELARAEGAKVVPLCPFIRHFVARHAEFKDLLAIGN
jgi:predicted GNAT family acetyltransferase